MYDVVHLSFSNVDGKIDIVDARIMLIQRQQQNKKQGLVSLSDMLRSRARNIQRLCFTRMSYTRLFRITDVQHILSH